MNLNDIAGTKKCIEELRTLRRLDKVKDIIDSSSEWTLLHQASHDNAVAIV